ncbi:hypothetical protein SCUP234_07403 [Seiridium cupressi]
MPTEVSATVTPDYFVTSHQFTKTVHRDRYPSTNPESPVLSQQGRPVIVTGATQARQDYGRLQKLSQTANLPNGGTIVSFLRLVGSDKEANIVNVGSWGMLNAGATGSSYFISKLALGTLSEAVPTAYPKVPSINYHPGMIVTDVAHEHPEVMPFRGDTHELESRAERIIQNNLLTIGLDGNFGIEQIQQAPLK